MDLLLHLLTKKGTNGYLVETCLDCHKVFKRKKKTGVVPFNPSAEGHTKEPAFCPHH